MDVVRPAVEQHDGGTSGWSGFDIPYVQDTSVDLLERVERRVRPCSTPCCGARRTVLLVCLGGHSSCLENWRTRIGDGVHRARRPTLIDYRNWRNVARTSSLKSWGCSQA